MELSNILNERKSELERFQIELQSLQKIEQEQRILIEKLSNNETWFVYKSKYSWMRSSRSITGKDMLCVVKHIVRVKCWFTFSLCSNAYKDGSQLIDQEINCTFIMNSITLSQSTNVCIPCAQLWLKIFESHRGPTIFYLNYPNTQAKRSQ